MATLPFLLASAFFAAAPKVTLHERAQPLSLLLPKLSPLVERRLAVHPALAREWVVVDVRDADPEELLARLAEVTHAAWLPEGGEYRLKRSAEMERKLLAEERAAHAASLRSQWTEALRPPFDAAALARRRREAQVQQSGSEGELEPKNHPAPMAVLDRYLNELLLQIPIETIANLPDRRGFVMSNLPQGSQRPLPASAFPIMNRMFRDHETFAGVMRSVDEDRYPDAAPVRMKLSVSAHRLTPSRARFFVQLTISDERGKVIGGSSRPFQTPPPPRLAPVPGPPFALSETATELERVLQKEVPFERAAPAVRELLLNPEREGRLSQLWSDVMFGLAARESRMLVANLPDIAEVYTVPRPTGPVSLDTYVARLTILEFRREGNWLTARPRHPGPAGRFRADRAAVGWAVRSVAGGKSISLEEAAQVEYHLGRSRWPMTTRHESVDPTSGAAIASLEADEPGHEVIRQLPPNMLAALYAGRPLSFGLLPTQLQTALRELYLQSGAYMILLVPDREGESAGGDDVEMSDVIGPAQVSGLVLRAKVTQDWAFIGRTSRAPQLRSLFEPTTLVRCLDDDLRPRKFESEETGEPETATALDEVQVIRSRTIDLSIHFPNGYRQDVSLKDYQFDSREPFVTVNRLPKPILDYLRKLKRAMADEGEDEGGSAMARIRNAGSLKRLTFGTVHASK